MSECVFKKRLFKFSIIKNHFSICFLFLQLSSNLFLSGMFWFKLLSRCIIIYSWVDIFQNIIGLYFWSFFQCKVSSIYMFTWYWVAIALTFNFWLTVFDSLVFFSMFLLSVLTHQKFFHVFGVCIVVQGLLFFFNFAVWANCICCQTACYH